MLAAKRAGLSRVLLPDLNQRDLEDIPPAALEGMRFEFLKTVDEALAHALEPSEDSSASPSSRSRARGEGGADTAPVSIFVAASFQSVHNNRPRHGSGRGRNQLPRKKLKITARCSKPRGRRRLGRTSQPSGWSRPATRGSVARTA